MKSLLYAVLLVMFGHVLAADDVRARVAKPSHVALTSEIDPDKGIYGIPFGTSEDGFVKRVGKPTGYLRLNSAETVLVYGRNHAFLFDGSRLRGVLISERIFDWELTRSLSAVTAFDGIRWRLNNGIAPEMSLTEVKKVLGSTLNAERYRYTYRTKKAEVELSFSHYTNEGDSDDSFKVASVFIKAKD